MNSIKGFLIAAANPYANRVHKLVGLSLAAMLVCTPALCQSGAVASDAAPNTIQMVPAAAMLAKALDTKKAKQGDPVLAKLEQPLMTGNLNLPKDTELVGQVDQVTASLHKSDSMIVVTFNQVKLKNGQMVPVKATVLQLAPPVSAIPAGVDGSSPAGGPSGDSQQGSGASGWGGLPGVTLKSDIHDQNSGTFASKGKNVHLPDGTQMEIAVAQVPVGVQIR